MESANHDDVKPKPSETGKTSTSDNNKTSEPEKIPELGRDLKVPNEDKTETDSSETGKCLTSDNNETSEPKKISAETMDGIEPGHDSNEDEPDSDQSKDVQEKSLPHLPTEVILKIASHLNPSDLANLSGVNSRFFGIIESSDELWKDPLDHYGLKCDPYIELKLRDETDPELASPEDRLPLACSEKKWLLEHRKLQSNIKTGKPASETRGPFRGRLEYPIGRPCRYGFGIWIEQHDQQNFFPTATLPTQGRNIQIVWKDESEAATTAATATTILNWNLPPAWVPPEQDLFPKSGKALSIHNDYFVMFARDCITGGGPFLVIGNGEDPNDHDALYVGKRVGQNVENLWDLDLIRANATNTFDSHRRVILTDRWIFITQTNGFPTLVFDYAGAMQSKISKESFEPVPEGEADDEYEDSDDEDYDCFEIDDDDEDEDALMPRYYKPSCYNADWIVFARLNVLRRIDLNNLSGAIVKTDNKIGSIAITDRNQIICCESELISVFDADSLTKISTIPFSADAVKAHGSGFFAWNRESFRLYKEDETEPTKTIAFGHKSKRQIFDVIIFQETCVLASCQKEDGFGKIDLDFFPLRGTCKRSRHSVVDSNHFLTYGLEGVALTATSSTLKLDLKPLVVYLLQFDSRVPEQKEAEEGSSKGTNKGIYL